jgi:hypothetical protein
VAYTDAQWTRLFRAMAAGELPPRARLLVARDAFDLAESGHVR